MGNKKKNKDGVVNTSAVINSKMQMKLLQLFALVAIFHGTYAGPIKSSDLLERTRRNANEAKEQIETAVKDISEGKGNIIKWFNQMGDSLKRQATDAVQDFQKKLEETTKDITQKFQEHKEKLLKSKHGETLSKLKETIAQKTTKL